LLKGSRCLLKNVLYSTFFCQKELFFHRHFPYTKQKLLQLQQQFDRNWQNLNHYNNHFSTRTVEFRNLFVVFVFLVAQQKAVVAAQLKRVAEQRIRIERWARKMVEGGCICLRFRCLCCGGRCGCGTVLCLRGIGQRLC